MAGLAACATTTKPVAETGQIGAGTVNVGHAALAAGHPDMAINIANAVLSHDPKDEAAWVLKSKAQYESGDVSAAAVSADHAVSLKPNDPAAEMALGRALDKTDPQRALKAFRIVHQARPQALGPALDLGIAYVQNGHPGKGVTVLEQVSSAHPDDPTVTMDLALALVIRNHPGDASRAASMLRPLAQNPSASAQLKAAYRFATRRANG